MLSGHKPLTIFLSDETHILVFSINPIAHRKVKFLFSFSLSVQKVLSFYHFEDSRIKVMEFWPF